jgi:hypothetical protein
MLVIILYRFYKNSEALNKAANRKAAVFFVE